MKIRSTFILVIHIVLFSAWTLNTQAQTPSWDWVNGIFNNSNLDSHDVAIENSTGESVIVGCWLGNLSTFLGDSGTEGTDFSSTYGGRDGFVARYDTLGNLVWAFKIGGPSEDEVRSVIFDQDGNIYVTGKVGTGTINFTGTKSITPDSILINSSNIDCFVAKYNGLGELLWLKSSLGSDGDVVGTAIATNSTAVFIAGNFTDNLTIGSQSYDVPASWGDVFLSKCDLEGNVQWIVGAGSPGYPDLINDLEVDNDGVFIIGSFKGTSLNVYDISGGIKESLGNVAWGWEDAFVSGYDTEGNLQWAAGIGSNSIDAGNGITIDDSSVYLTGGISNNAYFPGFTGNPVPAPNKIDIFLAGLDRSNGQTIWVQSIPSALNTDDFGNDVSIDHGNHLYVTGVFSNEITLFGDTTLVSEGGEDIFLASFLNDGSFLWAKSAGSNGNNDIGYSVASGFSDRIYLTGTYGKTSLFDSITLPEANNTNIFLGSLKSGFSPVVMPPVNDHPCSAILLPSADTCNAGIHDNRGSTDSGIPDPGCGNYRGSDVWFKAVIPPSGKLFVGTSTSDDETYPPVNGWMYRVEMAVYSGTCGSLNLEGCYSLNSGYHYRASSAYLFDKIPGDTVWIRIWDAFGNDFGNFSVCVNDPGHYPAWDFPETLCGEEGIIDLDTTLLELTFGFADNVLGSSGISDPDNAVSTPDAATAHLFDEGDWIKLDLTDTIPAGEIYFIHFRSYILLLDPTKMTLRTSMDDITYYEHSFKPETDQDVVTPHPIIAEHPTRYLYIENNNAGGGGFAVDGIKYFYRGTRGGTWSGPGVTGSIFDPAGLQGPVSITYSVGGTTTFMDSTRNVTVFNSEGGILSADTSVCGVNHTLTLKLEGHQGEIIKWESSEDGFLSSTPISNQDSLHTVSGLAQTTAFRVIVQDGSCDPDTSNTATVTVLEMPSADPGPYNDVCGNTLGLQAIPSVGSGTWSKTSGPGTVLFSPSENNPTVSVEVDRFGTYAFTWTETNGICTDDSTITVAFYEQPVANPGTGGDTCSFSFGLNAVPSAGSGVWSKIAGPGSVTFFPSDTLPDAVVSVSQAGSYTFQWTETNGICSSEASVTVNYSNPPVVDPGTGGQVCGLAFTLNAVPSFGTGFWVQREGPGITFFNPSENAPDATVTVSEAGTYEFLWTESDGTCSNDSVIEVTFIEIPIPDAGTGGKRCGSDFQLSAVPGIGTGQWTKSAGDGTAIFTPSPDQPNALVSVDMPGIYEFTWTETNGVCMGRDSIEVHFLENLEVEAGADKNVCGLQYDLHALPVDVPGHWISFSGPGTVSFTPSDSVHGATVTIEAFGEYVFKWEVMQGFCSGEDSVTIEFHNQPVADAGPDQVLDFEFSTYLEAISPEFGSGTWSLLRGSGDIADPSDPASLVSDLGLGENEFMWTITSEHCQDASDQVMITVNDIQSYTVITPNNDGLNDFLVFPGVENMNGSEIIIYNRWGIEVYRNENYQNNWDGKDHKGRELITDVYFYILRIPPDRVIKSFVEIKE